MSWNGSGSFTRTYGTTGWQTQAAAGTKIVANNHDTNDGDLATGINACLTRNNEAKPTATFSPNVDNSYDLGTTALRWRTGYVGTSMVWQGATFATTVTASPTANRTVVLPDRAGTLALQPTQSALTSVGTGTTVDDTTTIFATARRVTIYIIGVSTNGTSPIMLQLGDAGGIENSNYFGGVTRQTTAATGQADYSTGFQFADDGAAARVYRGKIVLELYDTAAQLQWVCSGILASSGGTYLMSGIKATSATLDRVRLTTVGGTDVFDAGSWSVKAE